MTKIFTKFKKICTSRTVGNEKKEISGYHGGRNMGSRFFSKFSKFYTFIKVHIYNHIRSLDKTRRPKVYVASIFGIVLTIASCAVGGVIAVASVAAWWSSEEKPQTGFPVENQENKTSFEEMSERFQRYDEQAIEREKQYQIWLENQAKKKPSDGSSDGSTGGSETQNVAKTERTEAVDPRPEPSDGSTGGSTDGSETQNVAKTERTEAVDPRPDDPLVLLINKFNQPVLTPAEAEAKAALLAGIDAENEYENMMARKALLAEYRQQELNDLKKEKEKKTVASSTNILDEKKKETVAKAIRLTEELSSKMKEVESKHYGFFTSYDNVLKHAKEQEPDMTDIELRKATIESFYINTKMDPKSSEAKELASLVKKVHTIADNESLEFKATADYLLSFSNNNDKKK